MSNSDVLGFISRGIITPFRRDQKLDFANSTDVNVVRSNVHTILNVTKASRTTQGEIPFNQKLGSLLIRIRHRNMDSTLVRELAIVHTVEALQENEPRVRVKEVNLIKDRTRFKATIQVIYDIVDITQPGSPIIAAKQVEEIFI